MKDAETIRKEFAYDGKPKQWQIGFDALLKHLPDYVEDKSCALYVDYNKSCQALKDRDKELNKGMK